jgi:hypothetical protein
VLYRPEAFEPLTESAWDERRVRDAIGEIVADAAGAYRPRELWPADEWDAWSSPQPLKTLYTGAAGVVWALHVLRERGYAEPALDLAQAARRTLEAWREDPRVLTALELPEPARASLLNGESGILAVLWRLAPSDEIADDLHALVRANVDNPADEVMWGAPGTMLAVCALHAWTGDERWAEAWRQSAAALLRRRVADGLWTQRLYGETYRGLTPLHGAVGNVLALGGGAEKTAALLRATAVVEGGLANWPAASGEPLAAGDGQIRLQWDCGAPGIVASAAAYLDEELLFAGAELVWQAGPHGAEKGPGICHGTAGNGYAFLKVFERTGDERWLERARRFAVHALEQAGRARELRGCGRYSLWTGDLGVAVYAADCLEQRTRYPILETWA